MSGRSAAAGRQPAALVPRLQVLAAALLFSTGGAVVKAISLTSWQVASFRSAFAAVAFLVAVPASRRGWSRRTLAVGAAYAGAMVCFVLANKLTTAASAIFLQSTAPLYIVLLGPWLLAEPIRRLDYLYMAILAGGLGLLFVGLDPTSATAPRPLLGDCVAAGAGLCWALSILGLRWLGRSEGEGGASGASAVLAGNLLACLFCLPFALPVAVGGAADWLEVAFLGLFQIGLAYVFLTTGIRQVAAFEASLLLLLEPVLNPVWAWIVHGEEPGPWSLAGGAVILLATTAKTWLDLRRRAPA